MRPGIWKIVVGVICVLWLALMVSASYFSYEYRSPVRIENWKPEPAQ